MNNATVSFYLNASVYFSLQNGKLVTAVSNNTVQIHTFPEGDPDGILTRFTTNANHVTFNSSGSRVAAGSRYDFLLVLILLHLHCKACLGLRVIRHPLFPRLILAGISKLPKTSGDISLFLVVVY